MNGRHSYVFSRPHHSTAIFGILVFFGNWTLFGFLITALLLFDVTASVQVGKLSAPCTMPRRYRRRHVLLHKLEDEDATVLIK